MKIPSTTTWPNNISYLEKVCYYAYVISKGLATDIQLISCISSLVML